MELNDKTGIPTIRGIAPYIEVFDMPSSLHFYRDILGFGMKASSGEGDEVDWVLLEHDGYPFMMNTAYEREHRPGSPDPDRMRWHRDTAFYFSCTDLDALYNYLSGNGLAPKKPYITGYGWRALSLTDPDGYGLCFHHPLQSS
jgi:uncharacterized glyoxalase superfamily protein PhnB